MKKIKLIFKLLPLLFLFIFIQHSFAQTSPILLFDLSKVVLQQKIEANAKNVQLIKLPPFTTIVVNPGTFDQDVTLFAYQGDFDRIKASLPQGQSPISSYYFKMFNTTTGLPTTPLLPLNVQSYNNYSNTNTSFYPVSPSEVIDGANNKTWTGNILVNTELPVSDAGFIVATNKILDKDDPALIAPVKDSVPSAAPSPSLSPKPLAAGSFLSQNLYIILLLALIAVSIIGIAFLLLKGSKKTGV